MKENYFFGWIDIDREAIEKINAEAKELSSQAESAIYDYFSYIESIKNRKSLMPAR
jgi:hypothetical protein